MKKPLPVLSMGEFHAGNALHDFYAETIHTHVQHHEVTARPHKHDFFVVMLFTKGSGTHEVDFIRYPISPGALFLLRPGQSHHWTMSDDADGIIFLHTREFFDKAFSSLVLRDYPFYNSIYNAPLLQLKRARLPRISDLFHAILREYRQQQPMKKEKLVSLVNLLYIETTRLYAPNVPVKSEQYLEKLRAFEDLLDLHFMELKLPSLYAGLMSMTERHLNRISKTCLNKTPSALILDRNMLEARRLMMRDQAGIADVASQLGYDDASYFSRLFKKSTGKTPREFMKGYAN